MPVDKEDKFHPRCASHSKMMQKMQIFPSNA